MKNIGILTYHRAINYGAVLQAYSLVNRLKHDFPDCNVEIVDYSTAVRARSHSTDIVRSFMHNGYHSGISDLKKNRVFNSFSNNLPLSKKHIVSDDISKVMDYVNEQYDVVISGSDAVFNWGSMKFPSAFLLGERLKSKKVSYAASSHRLLYKDLSTEKIEYCKKAFEDYAFMGIRDAETEAFVHYCSPNIKLQHTCDPTMFIDIQSVREQTGQLDLEKIFGITNDKPIIIIMSPDKNLGELIVKQFSNDFNIVSVFVHNAAVKHHCSILTPFEWAGIFQYAAITVTEYFHATIFSLLNGTPTLSVDKLSLNSGYEGKIHDLLHTRLGLPEFYMNIDELHDSSAAEVIKTVEKTLANDYRERIRTSIKKESQSYDVFKVALDTIIEGKNLAE